MSRFLFLSFLAILALLALPALASDVSGDSFGGLLTSGTAVKIGAGYSAVQALAYFLSLIVPAHTVVGRLARAVVKWPAQLLPTAKIEAK